SERERSTAPLASSICQYQPERTCSKRGSPSGRLSDTSPDSSTSVAASSASTSDSRRASKPASVERANAYERKYPPAAIAAAVQSSAATTRRREIDGGRALTAPPDR